MQRAGKAAIAIAGAAVLAVAFLWLRSPQDPLARGEPASRWVRALVSSDYAARNEAQAALLELGEPGVPQIRALLRKRNFPWQPRLASLNFHTKRWKYQYLEAGLCRRRAAEMLSLLGPAAAAAIPDLTAALAFADSADPVERALLRAGPASIPALEAAAAHPSAEIRPRAVKLLGEFKPLRPESIRVLVRAAQDPGELIRAQAARSLGSVNPSSASDCLTVRAALLPLARDPAYLVRAAALRSLRQAGPAVPETLAAAREALADRAALVRLEAAKTLWHFEANPAEIIPILVEILPTEEGWQAAYALGDIGPPAASAAPALVEVLRTERIARAFRTPPSSALALGKIGPGAIPALVEIITHADLRVRLNALAAFGFMGRPGHPAVPRLLGLLRDREREVRHVAALTLASLGAPAHQIIDGLKDCLLADDIFLRSSAAAALREIDPNGGWVVPAE